MIKSKNSKDIQNTNNSVRIERIFVTLGSTLGIVANALFWRNALILNPIQHNDVSEGLALWLSLGSFIFFGLYFISVVIRTIITKK